MSRSAESTRNESSQREHVKRLRDLKRGSEAKVITGSCGHFSASTVVRIDFLPSKTRNCSCAKQLGHRCAWQCVRRSTEYETTIEPASQAVIQHRVGASIVRIAILTCI